MGVNVFPIPSSSGGAFTYFPVSGAGTFNLGTTLTPGVYAIQADASQTFTLQFGTSSGYRFSGTVRGGSGFVTVHADSTLVVIPAGMTYPFILGFSRTTYQQAAAPTFGSFTFTGVSGANRVGTLTFSNVPSGATSVGYFDRGGAFVNMGTTSSPQTNQPISEGIAAGNTGQILLVARDANGIWSQAAVGTTGTASSATFRQAFTSSGLFTVPAGVNAVDLLVVAGGGSGGAFNGSSGSGGGGGAGGMLVTTGTAVTPGTTYVVTVGSGGGISGSTARGNNGSDSSFGSLVVATGGGGGGNGANANAPTSGGSGGGGGGTGQGSSTQNGAAGIAGQGNAGGASVNTAAAGGGGGKSAVGASAAAGGAGGAGLANDYTGTSITYAVGGSGTANGTSDSTPLTFNTGNGGNGAQYQNPGQGYNARQGSSGVVAVRWTL